ncbi:hypothetical protein BT96DRAFT_1021479 [Gymnopus androsaceus JB14]|uniref:Uncharacterized protein n=1 Tax=Gymnopus androsaceus JB14 TaxID=1447944 RepID=A0A6A4HEF2_9AGAR|nr:hypothetical protein BT96DRAFT_1021479 [Gymnopus androsaceus JB14]
MSNSYQIFRARTRMVYLDLVRPYAEEHLVDLLQEFVSRSRNAPFKLYLGINYGRQIQLCATERRLLDILLDQSSRWTHLTLWLDRICLEYATHRLGISGGHCPSPSSDENMRAWTHHGTFFIPDANARVILIRMFHSSRRGGGPKRVVTSTQSTNPLLWTGLQIPQLTLLDLQHNDSTENMDSRMLERSTFLLRSGCNLQELKLGPGIPAPLALNFIALHPSITHLTIRAFDSLTVVLVDIVIGFFDNEDHANMMLAPKLESLTIKGRLASCWPQSRWIEDIIHFVRLKEAVHLKEEAEATSIYPRTLDARHVSAL